MARPKRAAAALLAESTCPRCGVTRADDQAYCLECGLRLPIVVGPVAGLRRRWVRRVGWYPGDWVWLVIPLGIVAIAGAAVAITLDRQTAGAAAAATYVAAAPGSTAALAPGGRNGTTRWPASLSGWTVVLQSMPVTHGSKKPGAVARRAVHDGLTQVGVLASSAFGSLHPGYYVVFSGVYGGAADAATALTTVRSRGFEGAYVLRVAP
ncbi:MAG TPA: hypothetical protein VH063_16260 [Gaiellaceae bacterium]|nr:hypothetical protein [Gaiellaceae bacterium]